VRPTRFVQVGVGGFGHNWAGLLHGRESAELTALVDVDESALAAARDETGTPDAQCYSDYREAFRAVEADAALIVTPPAVHCDVALAAMEAGLHVLTEKPIADDMASARQMVDAAELAGLTLMVSQNYRFRRWVRTMRRLLTEGGFGPPATVSVHFAKAPRFDGSFRLQMEHPLVHDMSIHHFDLMRAVTGREPLSVRATTWKPQWSWFDHDPCAAAMFDFEGGLKVFYYGSWVARERETTWDGRWTVECPQAAIELREGRVHVTMADFPHQDSEVEMCRMPCENQEFALTEFQAAVAEGREPEASGRDNLQSLAMVFAAVESARSGTAVDIREIVEGA